MPAARREKGAVQLRQHCASLDEARWQLSRSTPTPLLTLTLMAAPPSRSWKRTVCPVGGAHAWQPAPAAEAQAPLATCAVGVVAAVLFWPALLLLPLVYLGSRVVAVRSGDRVCTRCGIVITNKVCLASPVHACAASRRR